MQKRESPDKCSREASVGGKWPGGGITRSEHCKTARKNSRRDKDRNRRNVDRIVLVGCSLHFSQWSGVTITAQVPSVDKTRRSIVGWGEKR